MARVLAAWLLLLLGGSLSADPLRWEGEDLAAAARIEGHGGTVLVIESADTEQMPFSKGKAMTFTPSAKHAELVLTLSVPQDGVYRMRLGVVLGPNAGVYRLIANGMERGEYNLHRPQQVHYQRSRDVPLGVETHRLLLKQGDNEFRFRFTGAVGRGGSLVIDCLTLEPDRPNLAQYRPTPYDSEPPADERLGPNLVRNGDFEAFTPTDQFQKQHQMVRQWSFNSAVPQERAPIVTDSLQSHSGEKSLRLVPDPLEHLAVVLQRLPMESGKRYRVTAWIKGPGTALIYVFQPPKTRVDDAVMLQNHFRIGAQWQRVSFITAPSPSSKITAVNLALYGIEGGDIRFDDVSVCEVLAGGAAKASP